MNPDELVRLEELLLAFLVEHATMKTDADIHGVLKAVRRRRTYLTRK